MTGIYQTCGKQAMQKSSSIWSNVYTFLWKWVSVMNL